MARPDTVTGANPFGVFEEARRPCNNSTRQQSTTVGVHLKKGNICTIFTYHSISSPTFLNQNLLVSQTSFIKCLLALEFTSCIWVDPKSFGPSAMTTDLPMMSLTSTKWSTNLKEARPSASALTLPRSPTRLSASSGVLCRSDLFWYRCGTVFQKQLLEYKQF